MEALVHQGNIVVSTSEVDRKRLSFAWLEWEVNQDIRDQLLGIYIYIYPADQILLHIYQQEGIIERVWMLKFFYTNKKKPLGCLLTEYQMVFICKYVYIYIYINEHEVEGKKNH